MSQATANIINQSRTLVRAAINAIVQAIQSMNSGTTAPSETYEFMPWADKTTGLWKIRNAANNNWITIGPLADLGIQSGAQSLGIIGGTADAITGAFNPPINTALPGATMWLRSTATNATTTPTLKPDGAVLKTIVKPGGGALEVADIVIGWNAYQYDTALDKYVLLRPAKGITSSAQKIINVVEATPYTTYTSAGSVSAYDDTIPQISEGTALMSVSITPTSATSRLRVEFLGYFGVSAGANFVWSAMYRDSTVNAVSAAAVSVPLNTVIAPMPMVYEVAAGSTSATTFSIRFAGEGITAYVNGSGLGRRFGGSLAATLRVTEIAA